MCQATSNYSVVFCVKLHWTSPASSYTELGTIMIKYCIILFWTWDYYAQILYYSILEFFHAIPMHILLLCSNYLFIFIIENNSTQKGTNIPPTGVHLSPLFILTAVTVCPDAGHCLTCLSELGQLFLPNLFATTWRFVHVPCYIILA